MGAGAYHELASSIAKKDDALVLGQKTAALYSDLLDW